LVFDHESGTILDANAYACDLYGYTLDEFRQLKAVDLSLEPERTMEVMKNQTRFVPLRVHKKKDGTKLPLELSINFHYRGQRKIITAVMHDITERQQSEKELSETRRRFRNVVDSSPMGVLLYELMPDQSLIFRGCNAWATKVLGVDRSDFIGQPIESVFPPLGETEIPTRYKEVCATGKPWKSEQVDYQDEMISGAYEVYAFQTFPNNMAVFFVDITDRKRAEQERRLLEDQLRQAQKMEAVGTLAGGIAHDFNNLLMGIVGNTSLVLANMEKSDPHHERLKNIDDLSKSGAELTQQLLGFARGGKYQVKPTDLNDLIEKNLNTFGRTRKEIEIEYDFEKDLLAVEVDRGQIEQVLLNLCVNASQAMPGGGRLLVRTENVGFEEDRGKPMGVSPGEYVKVTVTDNGIGMDEDTLKRVFEPFFTTKEMGRGTGLGLATVYGIIKSHGGQINVDSEKGKGTTFAVYLPSTGQPALDPPQEVLEEISGQETVMIVDDEEMVLEVGGHMLEHLGYKVLSAKDGSTATDLLSQNMGAIDLIILDMVMPKISGGQTYDRLRAIDPNVRVLLSSGYSINGEASEILSRGCSGFIQKPFDIKQLSLKIRELLDG